MGFSDSRERKLELMKAELDILRKKKASDSEYNRIKDSLDSLKHHDVKHGFTITPGVKRGFTKLVKGFVAQNQGFRVPKRKDNRRDDDYGEFPGW